MASEEAFAAEAQEEAILRRPRSFQLDTEEDVLSNENSPLIPRGGITTRPGHSRAAKSYDRAINQPWTGAQGSAGLPWHKKPSIFWLLPAFFPFCIAFGGIIVPKTYLILNLICQDYLSDKASKDPAFHFLPVLFESENPQCRDAHVQALVARFQLYMNLLTGIFSAILTPQLGALSDRIGRKKVIVFASTGGVLMEVITILAGTYPEKVSVNWMLLGSLLDGLCGSFTTGMALAFAYAADCTAPDRRNVAFGYFHGTLFSGIALGPILAGYIIKVTGNIMICFYVAIACHGFFILFILGVAPESLSKERQILAREKWQEKMQTPQYRDWFTIIKNYNILEPLWVLWPRGTGSSAKLRKNLFLLAAIDTTMFGVAMGTMNIILIYAEFKFGWNAVDSSVFLSVVNIGRVSGLIIVLPLLTRWFRGPVKNRSSAGHGSDMLDINVIRGAIVFDLIGYIGYAFVPTGALLILSGLIASFGGMGPPTLQSSLTKSVPSDRTGQMLGASGLLHALARVVAPTIFNLIYSETVGKFAGTVFICLSSLFVAATIMSWFLKPNVYLDDSIDLQSSTETSSEEPS